MTRPAEFTQVFPPELITERVHQSMALLGLPVDILDPRRVASADIKGELPPPYPDHPRYKIVLARARDEMKARGAYLDPKFVEAQLARLSPEERTALQLETSRIEGLLDLQKGVVVTEFDLILPGVDFGINCGVRTIRGAPSFGSEIGVMPSMSSTVMDTIAAIHRGVSDQIAATRENQL